MLFFVSMITDAVTFRPTSSPSTVWPGRSAGSASRPQVDTVVQFFFVIFNQPRLSACSAASRTRPTSSSPLPISNAAADAPARSAAASVGGKLKTVVQRGGPFVKPALLSPGRPRRLDYLPVGPATTSGGKALRGAS